MQLEAEQRKQKGDSMEKPDLAEMPGAGVVESTDNDSQTEGMERQPSQEKQSEQTHAATTVSEYVDSNSDEEYASVVQKLDGMLTQIQKHNRKRAWCENNKDATGARVWKVKEEELQLRFQKTVYNEILVRSLFKEGNKEPQACFWNNFALHLNTRIRQLQAKKTECQWLIKMKQQINGMWYVWRKNTAKIDAGITSLSQFVNQQIEAGECTRDQVINSGCGAVSCLMESQKFKNMTTLVTEWWEWMKKTERVELNWSTRFVNHLMVQLSEDDEIENAVISWILDLIWE